MGAPKYRAPLHKKKEKPNLVTETSLKEIESIKNKIKAELNKPEQLKKITQIIEQLLKN